MTDASVRSKKTAAASLPCSSNALGLAREKNLFLLDVQNAGPERDAKAIFQPVDPPRAP